MVENVVVSFAECKGSPSGSMNAYTIVVANLHVASSTLITVFAGNGNARILQHRQTSLTL